jgi:hypothetical protein
MLIIVVIKLGAAGASAHPAGETAVSQSIDHLMMIWSEEIPMKYCARSR